MGRLASFRNSPVSSTTKSSPRFSSHREAEISGRDWGAEQRWGESWWEQEGTGGREEMESWGRGRKGLGGNAELG